MSTPVTAFRPVLPLAAGSRPLGEWLLAATGPNEVETPSQIDRAVSNWIPAQVPGTVAHALQAAGRWNLDRPEDFDARDWWYRCRFDARAANDPQGARLRFEGLATLAEVWLNDRPILAADNMFRAYSVDVSELLDEANELTICFRSLSAALSKRRPRPRWKTRLVNHQQLRWFRTTLLGRIPGWSPPIAPVGPWRGVVLEEPAAEPIAHLQVRPLLDGRDGIVEVVGSVRCDRAADVSGTFSLGDVSHPLNVERQDDGVGLRGRIRLRAPERWWPHTHGAPYLHPCRVHISVDRQEYEREAEPIGFRTIAADPLADGFGIRVNDVPVFCRGACWTCSDIVSLSAPPADLLSDLTRLRDAGANMVRVGGTMVYESDEFYRQCDALGLLVWQDFMFANMDYPADDDGFLRSAAEEAAHQLQRLSARACIAVYCGNSEVEQQAAMLGIPPDAWRNRLFASTLPELCEQWHPGVPYVPSTPTGGALPFHVAEGLAHYYGVGAYRRPLSDVRRADVKFTPECLGFANVPEPAIVNRVMQGDAVMTHDPRWKRRVPRDTGAGWDFEDVRDFYLEALFSQNVSELRASDPQRYLALGLATTGELMSQVYAEWRSPHSRCRGALVWFFKDLWPGAGWGLLDSDGTPKACYYHVRRAWQSRAILLTDEGLDGVHLHIVNDLPEPLAGTATLTLLRDGRVTIARGERRCRVDSRGLATFGSDELLGGFYDVTHAYRFGPLTHTVVAARLTDDHGAVVAETFWFPDLAAVVRSAPSAVSASARAAADDEYDVTIVSDAFLYAAQVDAEGFMADDNYFCLMPGDRKVVRLRRTGAPGRTFSGFVSALNLPEPARMELGPG